MNEVQTDPQHAFDLEAFLAHLSRSCGVYQMIDGAAKNYLYTDLEALTSGADPSD
jgi:hypothetical protein